MSLSFLWSWHSPRSPGTCHRCRWPALPQPFASPKSEPSSCTRLYTHPRQRVLCSLSWSRAGQFRILGLPGRYFLWFFAWKVIRLFAWQITVAAEQGTTVSGAVCHVTCLELKFGGYTPITSSLQGSTLFFSREQSVLWQVQSIRRSPSAVDIKPTKACWQETEHVEVVPSTREAQDSRYCESFCLKWTLVLISLLCCSPRIKPNCSNIQNNISTQLWLVSPAWERTHILHDNYKISQPSYRRPRHKILKMQMC